MELLRKLRSLQFRFSRWLLFIWIKPTILDGSRQALGLDEDDLICYVLHSRSISDLLVTDMACDRAGLPLPRGSIPLIEEERSFFFLGHPEGTLGRKTLRQQSERMVRLIQYQQQPGARKIKVVPVSLFWGHQPDREKSLLKVLLSENWSATSRVKRFFAMLFHRSHILVQFCQPIHLDVLVASEQEQSRQIRKLLRLLRVNFNNQRQAIIGPDLSHRRTLIDTILASKEVRGAIEREARNSEKDIAAIEKKAMLYAREIASDQSYRVIRFFDVLLTWLWNNLYDGIDVNRIEELKQLAQSHEIVYTPCHRSHIDYLLLSYVLYHNGLTPPHIAAGKNLNLPLIGSLLRRAGAFYMRRTFKGDTLYKEVFDEYLHQMFTKGFSVEYFIEGGRSRTGRTLTPRTGMLSMTVRSFQKDSTKPIAFMPVYFGYERVIESSTYISELAGKDKQSESVFDVFKIFSSFKHEFGKVTVNFGEPLLLKDFLDNSIAQWSEPEAVSPVEFSAACRALGQQLATRINSSAAIQSTNLVALALLSTTRQSIEEKHLAAQVELLRAIARGIPHDGITITQAPVDEILDEAINIFGLSRFDRQFGTIVSASPQQAVNLTYNANNVLHIFALPSLISRFVRTSGATDRADLYAFTQSLYPYIKSEMFLPWQEQELPEVLDQIVECLISLKIIHESGSNLSAAPRGSREFNCLKDLAVISDPTLERFYIVLALLQRAPTTSLKALEGASAGIAEQLSVLYGINSPDFFEKSLFSTFISSLRESDAVNAELCPGAAFSDLETTAARTLDTDVRYNIDQAVENYFDNP